MFLTLAAGSFFKGISGLVLSSTAIPVIAGYMDLNRAVATMVLQSQFNFRFCDNVVGTVASAWPDLCTTLVSESAGLCV
jgi:hypothetical protein